MYNKTYMCIYAILYIIYDTICNTCVQLYIHKTPQLSGRTNPHYQFRRGNEFSMCTYVNSYIYIYIYTYTYISIYLSLSLYIYIYMYLYTHVYLSLYT